MLRKLKSLIYTKPFSIFAYYLIQMYSMTYRLKIINEDRWLTLLKNNKNILLCTWHQQFFAGIRHFRHYSKFKPAIMISQSNDGTLISGVAEKNGWRTVRGSSSRGGKQALDSMIDHLITHGIGVHILDGPQGPIGKVKPGVIKMAHESNSLIVPFYIQAEKAWFFNSWDRFMLPKPFSKVTITFKDELDFKANDPAHPFEQQILDLEKIMLPGLLNKTL